MAIAGRSYPNVPITSRGSLESSTDFNSKVPALVVTSQPTGEQTRAPRVTVLRNTLQDPPVLTTPSPVIIAAPNDRRWFVGVPPRVLVNPQAPAVVTGVATPEPVVVSAPPGVAQVATPPSTILRNTLQDPPVLTTTAPVVVAAATDSRWFARELPTVTSNPQAPVVPASSTPSPVVVSLPPPIPNTVQASVTRNTLQDPPVLTTPSPVVVTVQTDERWLAGARPTVLSAPLVPSRAPSPVIVSVQTAPRPGRSLVIRGSLFDTSPPASPIVVAAEPDRRWYGTGRLVLVVPRASHPVAPTRSGLLLAAGI
jgi:hypothetical protein